MYWLFLLAIALQAVYFCYFFWRIYMPAHNQQVQGAACRPVSIVICAKNEAENLRTNLPAVLAQKYPVPFEVIVVNDASTDETGQVLQELESQYDKLWDVVIAPDAERNLQGKKFALSKGVAHATYDWLLLTDADCLPASDKWLELMVAPIAAGKEIVAGYGGYNKGPGLLNAFIRWETLHTFLQYSTYLLADRPYMAVGRNLACTRKVFEEAQKSEVWNALPSGDDDLLMNIMGDATNASVVFDRQAFTYTDAKSNWRDWAKQKQRHLSTGKYYKGATQGLLAIFAMSHALLWLTFFALICTGHLQLVLLIMGMRCAVYWSTWLLTAAKLNERSLFYFFPLFDIGWVVYNFAFLPYITWKNKMQWK